VVEAIAKSAWQRAAFGAVQKRVVAMWHGQVLAGVS
jgi:hypothetical protein